MRKKRRRRLRWVIIPLAAALVVLAIVLCVRSCRRQEDAFTQLVLGVPVYTELIPEGNPARPGIQRRIKYVVIHETGNRAAGSDAESHSNFLLYNNDSNTSWHYTVDDRQIYHHIPDTEVAWHAGDRREKDGGNMNGIGVEICVNQDGDFDKALDNAERLTAYLLKEYGLSVDDVRQHADFISKNCPETIRDQERMEEFLDKVRGYLDELAQEPA